jgi:hypothetical protein
MKAADELHALFLEVAFRGRSKARAKYLYRKRRAKRAYGLELEMRREQITHLEQDAMDGADLPGWLVAVRKWENDPEYWRRLWLDTEAELDAKDKEKKREAKLLSRFRP